MARLNKDGTQRAHPYAPLFPAKAGIQAFLSSAEASAGAQLAGVLENTWVPAFAGMSG